MRRPVFLLPSCLLSQSPRTPPSFPFLPALAELSGAGLFRNKLREKVVSGDLEAAESKAEVLGELCDSLKFDPASASSLHSSLYRQKLSTVLEKMSITDADDEELQKMCRLLCLQKAEVSAVHKELCGGIVKAAIEDALSAGYEAFGADDRENVKKAIKVREPRLFLVSCT